MDFSYIERNPHLVTKLTHAGQPINPQLLPSKPQSKFTQNPSVNAS